METIRIENRIGVRATAERLWEVLTDFGGWNRWNPHEVEVEGALGFGAPISLTERLPDLGERQVKAQLGEWEPNAQLVWIERRGFLFRTLRYYEIEELERGACIVSHGTVFTGLRAELFHDKHRARIRPAYQAISEALKRTAEEG